MQSTLYAAPRAGFRQPDRAAAARDGGRQRRRAPHCGHRARSGVRSVARPPARRAAVRRAVVRRPAERRGRTSCPPLARTCHRAWPRDRRRGVLPRRAGDHASCARADPGAADWRRRLPRASMHCRGERRSRRDHRCGACRPVGAGADALDRCCTRIRGSDAPPQQHQPICFARRLAAPRLRRGRSRRPLSARRDRGAAHRAARRGRAPYDH